MGPRTYMFGVTLMAGLALLSVAALNVAMDPYGMREGEWGRLRASGWSQEPDRMPDRGLSGRVASARRGQADVLLVGTSRTMHGFAAAPHRINAGLTNASFDEQRVIVRAAAASDDPPSRIMIEAATLLTVEPGRRRFLTGPRPAERLFSTVATETSLRLLIAPRPYVFSVTPEDESARRDMSSRPLTAFGELTAPVYLDGAVGELRRLCRAGGGRSVIYEPPLGPVLAQAPEVRSAVALRVQAYRHAIERTPGGPCRPLFVDLSGLDGRPLSGVADPANWYDNTHFKPPVGEQVLRALVAASD